MDFPFIRFWVRIFNLVGKAKLFSKVTVQIKFNCTRVHTASHYQTLTDLFIFNLPGDWVISIQILSAQVLG